MRVTLLRTIIPDQVEELRMEDDQLNVIPSMDRRAGFPRMFVSSVTGSHVSLMWPLYTRLSPFEVMQNPSLPISTPINDNTLVSFSGIPFNVISSYLVSPSSHRSKHCCSLSAYVTGEGSSVTHLLDIPWKYIRTIRDRMTFESTFETISIKFWF